MPSRRATTRIAARGASGCDAGYDVRAPACPRCGKRDSRVLETRAWPPPNGEVTRRRRRCRACSLRFTTHQPIERVFSTLPVASGHYR